MEDDDVIGSDEDVGISHDELELVDNHIEEYSFDNHIGCG